jgi:hypothetical protein
MRSLEVVRLCSFSPRAVLRRPLWTDVEGDVLSEGLGEELDHCLPYRVLVASVVHAPHAVLAGDQPGGSEVFERLLNGALCAETEVGGKIGGIHQSVALSDRGHHREAMLLAEHDR